MDKVSGYSLNGSTDETGCSDGIEGALPGKYDPPFVIVWFKEL